MEDERKKLIDEEIVDEKIEEDRETTIKRISYKIMYPLMIFVALGAALAGIIIDKYFWFDLKSLSVPSNAEGNLTRLDFSGVIASTQIDTNRLDGAGARIVEKYASKGEMLSDPDFMAFHDQIMSVDYVSSAWFATDVMGYVIVGLLAIAGVMQLVFREFPSTMAFKVGARIHSSWRSATPVWLIFNAALLGLFRLLLVTSFVQAVATRTALFSLKAGLAAADWENFLAAVDKSGSRAYQLKVLMALGGWFKHDGAGWKISTFAILVSAGLCLNTVLTVFYMDTRAMRLRLKLDAKQTGTKLAIRDEMRRLPSICKIRSIWFSLSSFGLAVVVTKIAGRFVSNEGREINVRAFLTPRAETPDNLINDLIVNRTNDFWFQPPDIVDGAVLFWVPLVIMLIVGSVNRRDCASKLIEQLSYGYWIRIFSIAATIYPTASSVLKNPTCYDETIMLSWWDAIKTNEFCNDMIYSGHATLALTPAFILCFMLIYGPYEHKTLTIVTLMLCVLISCGTVIVGRFHYTADVLLSMIVCALMALIHAPAWKVIFHFRRFELKVGSVSGIERTIGQLESVGEYLYAVSKTRRIDNALTDWKSLEVRNEKIRKYLDTLQSQATDASN